MHPIVTNINKRGGKKKSRYMMIQHILLYKRIIRDIEGEKIVEIK